MRKALLLFVALACLLPTKTATDAFKANSFLQNNQKTVINVRTPPRGSKKIPLLLQVKEKAPSTPNKCSSEWNLHDTYCNYTALQQYAIDDKIRFSSISQQLKQNLFIASKAFLQVKAGIHSLNANTNSSLQASDEQKAKKKIAQFCDSNLSQSYFSFWSRVTSSASFNSSVDMCNQAMVNARSNSLCGLCSGRSPQFFFQKKVLVDESLCSRVVPDCKLMISDVVQFFEGATLIAADIANASRSNFSSSNIQQYLKESEKIQQEITKTKLHKLISTYIANPSNLHLEKAICEKFVTIHDNQLMSNILQNIVRTKEILYRLLDIPVPKTKEADIKSPSNYVDDSQITKKRLLQSGSVNSTLFFTGDVIMIPKKTDSSYSSFFGSTGSSGNELSDHTALPINTTSAFP